MTLSKTHQLLIGTTFAMSIFDSPFLDLPCNLWHIFGIFLLEVNIQPFEGGFDF